MIILSFFKAAWGIKFTELHTSKFPLNIQKYFIFILAFTHVYCSGIRVAHSHSTIVVAYVIVPQFLQVQGKTPTAHLEQCLLKCLKLFHATVNFYQDFFCVWKPNALTRILKDATFAIVRLFQVTVCRFHSHFFSKYVTMFKLWIMKCP